MAQRVQGVPKEAQGIQVQRVRKDYLVQMEKMEIQEIQEIRQ